MVPTDVAAEIELLRAMVGKYFPIYDVKVSAQSVQIFISPDVSIDGRSFESLRKEMNDKMFIPFISHPAASTPSPWSVRATATG